MESKTKRKGAPTEDLFPRVRVEDKAVKAADGHLVTRGWTIRAPARFSEKLRATVPTRVGVVRDLFRVPNGPKPDQVVAEVALDGGGIGYFDAATCRRSHAEVENGTGILVSAPR